MKLHFRHLTLAWYSCHHLLILTSGVAGRGEEEEEEDEQVLRPSSEWLEAFYSNVDNVLIDASLTPAASDLPDLPEDYIPPQTTTTTTTGDGTSNDAEESSTRPTTTKPPEMSDKNSGRRRLGRWLQGLLPGQQQQQQAQAIGLNILFNSDGIPYQPLSPPDTVGDVGKDHYVQMTNSQGGSAVRVLNKSDGSLNKTFELDGLGGSGTPCATGLGDPIVLYDQLASRWFLSEFGAMGNILCVYISTSDNAAGTYWRYEFPTPNFPDYPKYGVWTDAYYVGTNEPDTAAMYALERSPMLLGAPAKMVRNAGPTQLGGFGFQMMPPVDADGITPPPTGPGLFVRHVDDESHDNYETNSASDVFEIYSLAINFATLTSTLALLQTMQVTEFDSNLCGLTSFSCIPQPGAGNKVFLDPLREVVMNRPQYRNFGTHESLLVTWATRVGTVSPERRGAATEAGINPQFLNGRGDDIARVRWMELRKQPGGVWTVHQQNDYTLLPDDTTNRWMSSIAMNGCGDIALGYSVSSTTVSPGIRVTGRLSPDPLNQLDAVESNVVEGGAGGSSSSNRWGDYSAMAVDPEDDATFWYTNEYIPVDQDWSTRIVKFTLGTSTDCAGGGRRDDNDEAPCGPVRKLFGICK